MFKRTLETLLIKDNKLDVELVNRMLASPEAESHDVAFNVHSEQYLSKGLERLGKEEFDLVLLDLRLPDSEGLGSVKRVLEQAPERAVVVLTGQADEMLGVQATRDGAQDYLNKDGLTAAQLVRSLLYAVERNAHRLAQRKLRVAEHEYNAAAAVQAMLLPTAAPIAPGFDIAGGCWPFDRVGGDYFDYFAMDEGHLGIVIADVSGHGLGSALIMAGLRRLFRSCAEMYNDVSQILTVANRAVCDDTQPERFVTAFFAQLDLRTRRLAFAGAGHEAYVLKTDGSATTLASMNYPLGLIKDTEMRGGEDVTLLPGELLLLVTDGVYEACNTHGEQWGLQSVLEVVHDHRTRPAEEIIGQVCSEVHDFCKPNAPTDDMAMVVIKVDDATMVG